MIAFCAWQYYYNWISIQGDMSPSSRNDARLTFYMMLKCIYTLVTLHKSKLPECIYTEGHIAFIPGRFALKHMYMLYCTFAMSDCISQMLEFHFGFLIHACESESPSAFQEVRDFQLLAFCRTALYMYEFRKRGDAVTKAARQTP